MATQAGCRISGELADLAPRWIAQGTVSRRAVVTALESDRIRFFITPRSFFEHDRFFRDYLQRCFAAPRQFLRTGGDGRGLPALDLFERRADVSCAQNPGAALAPTAR